MDRKRFYHDHYNLRSRQFQKLRDCFEGQDAIRERGTNYLPRPSGLDNDSEGDANYASYKNRATYYSVLERTLRSLLGIVFRVPPSVDVPDGVDETLSALTSEGDSLGESLRHATIETLHMGRHGLLLDLPANESTAARPYIAHYDAEDVTNWREDIVDGRKVVTMVMLRDALQEGDEESTERYRELLLEDGVYAQRCWCVRVEKVNDKPTDVVEQVGEDIVPRIRGAALTYIPFWFIGPYSNKPALAKSPMLDLANESLNHYQIGADWRQALHMLAQPTPWLASDQLFQDDKQTPTKIGAGAFWLLPSDARVGMLEYSGAGTRDLLEALQRSENTMAALGAKLIHRGRQPETAEAVRIKARDEISVVESTVMSVSDAYKGVLETMAEWLGAMPEDVNFGMDRDFIEENLDAGMLSQLIKACFEDFAISREVYHKNLQRGGIIPTSRSVDDEIEDGATGKKGSHGKQESAEEEASGGSAGGAAGGPGPDEGSGDPPGEGTGDDPDGAGSGDRNEGGEEGAAQGAA